MKCPQCDIEMMIKKTYTEVEGDTSPDTVTKVFNVQDMTCRNPKCENFEKVVKTVKNQIL